MKALFSNLIGRFILFYSILLPFSCSEFVDVGPPKTQIVSQTVFESEASASSAIVGVYSLMMANTSFTRGAMEEYTGTASDELTNYSTNASRMQFYQNALTTINSDVLNVFWGEAYKYISNANIILEGLERSGIPSDRKNKLIGEALFVRAFCHFYLANLFGGVPYLTSSSYEVNSKASRDTFDQVMLNIENDLTKARELMSSDFPIAGERIRPNKDAATALLARLDYLKVNGRALKRWRRRLSIMRAPIRYF